MNQRGFSLIEVVITAGVFAILMLVQAQMMANQARANRAQSISFDYMQFIESVNSNLSTPSTCNPAIAGQPYSATPGARTAITYMDSTGAVSVGTIHNQYKFTQVELEHVSNVPMTANSYNANLNISADKIGEIVGPRGMHKSLRLVVVVPGATVSECYNSTDLTLQKICVALIGVFDPISQTCNLFP